VADQRPVTSRRRLTALEDAIVISLDTLAPAEAATLLARLAAGDAAVGEISRAQRALSQPASAAVVPQPILAAAHRPPTDGLCAHPEHRARIRQRIWQRQQPVPGRDYGLKA
jgi:hypothetical protein